MCSIAGANGSTKIRFGRNIPKHDQRNEITLRQRNKEFSLKKHLMKAREKKRQELCDNNNRVGGIYIIEIMISLYHRNSDLGKSVRSTKFCLVDFI